MKYIIICIQIVIKTNTISDLKPNYYDIEHVNKNIYIIITLILYELTKNIVNNLVYVTKILMILLHKTINL